MPINSIISSPWFTALKHGKIPASKNALLAVIKNTISAYTEAEMS